MIFTELNLKGAYLIEIAPWEDERGFFARSFCAQEFEKHGLISRFVQNNISYNKKKGTLRGMHYQEAPYSEAKLVSCIKGALFDVFIDLREHSPTFNRWEAIKLCAAEFKMAYIPPGFAHGYQTLQDETVVFYQVSEFYHPDAAKTISWENPDININWPLAVSCISMKDAGCAFHTTGNSFEIQ
jgi:dTDP-4-dehydrorhamnose 3,5-epimerase